MTSYSRVDYQVVRYLFNRNDLADVRFLTSPVYDGDAGGKVEVIAAEVPADRTDEFWVAIVQEAHYAGRMADVVTAIRTHVEAGLTDDGLSQTLVFPGFQWGGFPEDGEQQAAGAAERHLIETDEYEGGPVE